MRKETLGSIETQSMILDERLLWWFSYGLNSGVATEEELRGCGGLSECTLILSQIFYCENNHLLEQPSQGQCRVLNDGDFQAVIGQVPR